MLSLARRSLVPNRIARGLFSGGSQFLMHAHSRTPAPASLWPAGPCAQAVRCRPPGPHRGCLASLSTPGTSDVISPAEIAAGSGPASLTVGFLCTVTLRKGGSFQPSPAEETPPTRHAQSGPIVCLHVEALCFMEFNWWEHEEGGNSNTNTPAHTRTHTAFLSWHRVHGPENRQNVLPRHQLKPFRRR